MELGRARSRPGPTRGPVAVERDQALLVDNQALLAANSKAQSAAGQRIQVLKQTERNTVLTQLRARQKETQTLLGAAVLPALVDFWRSELLRRAHLEGP